MFHQIAAWVTARAQAWRDPAVNEQGEGSPVTAAVLLTLFVLLAVAVYVFAGPFITGWLNQAPTTP